MAGYRQLLKKTFKERGRSWWCFSGTCCDRFMLALEAYVRELERPRDELKSFRRIVNEVWAYARGRTPKPERYKLLTDPCAEMIPHDYDMGDPIEVWAMGQSAGIGIVHSLLPVNTDLPWVDADTMVKFLEEIAIGRLSGGPPDLLRQEHQLQKVVLDCLDGRRITPEFVNRLRSETKKRSRAQIKEVLNRRVSGS